MLKPQDIETSDQTPEKPRFYRFGEFEMDSKEETLCRDGEKLRINRRSFQVLRLLVERAGEVVTKQEFSETVWADTFVEDNSLTVTMTTLRKILGDDYKQPTFIENLPRKGYRFIAEVTAVDNRTPEAEIAETETEPLASVSKEEKKSTFKSQRFILGTVSLGLLLLLGVFGFSYFGGTNEETSSTNAFQIESIAVLPFENQNADTEYLSDGLTESVINDLSGLPNLRVISRNSVFQYKGKSTDLTTVGRELNVRAVLTGRFVQHGDEFIINAELIDVRDNKQIWGRQYNRQTAGVFAIQQEISRDISETLRAKLSGEERQRIARRETDSPEAFGLYLKGRYYWNKRTAENFEKAIEFFKQAIDKDPTYALAYVGLANCYLSASFRYDVTLKERVAMVKSAADKALEIDPTLGEVYATLALNSHYSEWNWENAEREYQRAIELNPNYATAHHWYADLLATEGRFDESFAEYRRALELDPLSLAVSTDLGLNYYFARHPDRAIEHLEKLKKTDPNYARTYLFLGQIYKGEAMFEESIAAFDSYAVLSENSPGFGDDLQMFSRQQQMLREAFKASGAKGYWKKSLEFAAANEKFDTVQMAIIYARLGERDKAFELLEKACDGHHPTLVWLKVSPEFDNLRADPRFAELMRCVGLPQ